MKKTRRIAAMIAATALAATMVIPAMSFSASAYNVTITQNDADKGTHTYGAYQIFAGTLAADGTLSNITWGSGITAAGQAALGDAAAYAKSITAATAPTKAAELAGYLASPEKTGSATIEGLTGGYYLIQDTVEPTGSPASRTKFILKVVKDETVDVDVKSSVPSVEKKVQDINDSEATPTLSGLQDSADYEIGDSIPYTITATIGNGIENFEKYSFEFHDEMSPGLSMDDAVEWKITIGGKDVTANFTMTNTGNTYTWAVTDNDLKAYTYTEGGTATAGTLAAGDEVVLTYNAYLNANAVVGAAGNPNEVWLQFDNNPNSCGNGSPTAETPKDKNIVFTYQTIINKVDDKGTALVGANFTLFKKVNDTWVDVTTLGGTGGAKPTKTGDETGSTFTFSGLDDGDYKLSETATPRGYDSISDIEFKITATHDIISDDPQLTALTGTGGIALEPNLTAGSLTGQIVNVPGAQLPSTGGIGTTLFILCGSIGAAITGVYLVSRKRTKEEAAE